MRKIRFSSLRILSFLALLAISLTSSSQAPFSTTIIDYWMNGYPIITNLWELKYLGEHTWNSTLDTIPADYCPINVFDAIVEINGKDVKGCTNLDPFFNESPHVTVKVKRWPMMETNVIQFENLKFNPEHSHGDDGFIRMGNSQNDNITVLRKSEVDFSQYRTYDFLILGEEPLVDSKILEVMMEKYPLNRMVRNEETPDVIFTVAKNADQSISATYIPPTTETVNDGSTTRPVYNYLTRQTSYETTQHNRTIIHGGRTELTTSTTMYLEITALDAKKMSDPTQTSPPEIWKAVYSVSDVNDPRPILDRYLSIAEDMQFPFDYAPAAIGYNLGMGAEFQPISGGKKVVVSAVLPVGRAAQLGLRVGDVITKINGKDKFKFRISLTDGSEFDSSHVVNLGTLLSQQYEEQPSLLQVVMAAKKMNADPSDVLCSSYKYKDIGKSPDEFTVERDGMKIKLFGNLFDPNATHIRIADFWDIVENSPIFYLDFE